MMGEGDQKGHWESVYARSADHFGTEPSQFGRDALRRFKEEGHQVVLELGCGQGRDALLLVEAGLSVIGLDYSLTGVCQLRQRCGVRKGAMVELIVHDARDGIPLSDESVDACFSHMFFTMQLTDQELSHIFSEVLRVLRPGGLNIYSVRSVNDPHYRKGVHRGDDMWEMNGFVVHYFSLEKVRRLAEGYEIVEIEEFTEGGLPKMLYGVALRKPPSRGDANPT